MSEGGSRGNGKEELARDLHELQNHLSVIRLSAGFALKSAAGDEMLIKDLQAIVDAAERGAELVQRLEVKTFDAG